MTEKPPLDGQARDDAIAYESAWLIERPSDNPGRPFYWKESVVVKGLGEWTQDPWQATRYVTQEDAERELRRWSVHPTIPEAKAVSHGFATEAQSE